MADTEKEIRKFESDEDVQDQVENDSTELTEEELEKIAGAGEPPDPGN